MQLWEIIQREPKWPLPQLKSESESCSVESWLFATPWTIYSPWNSPSQNTGVGSLSLLQWIFPTQKLNWGLLNCRRSLHQLSHRGSTRILGWVACPFSSRSFWPRNWTGILCIADGFLTNWAIPQLPNGNILEKPVYNTKTRMLTLIQSTNLFQISQVLLVHLYSWVCLYLFLYSFTICICVYHQNQNTEQLHCCRDPRCLYPF